MMKTLASKLRHFAAERDWDKFHSPKNLAMALSAEVGELAELFQWLTEQESTSLPPDKLQRAREEIGDIQIYLARLSDRLGIDPLEAAFEKMEVNELKYPVEKAKGTAKKYKEL
jgi:NTP pyrophosphatase (non-canonical NTP hydrolase)